MTIREVNLRDNKIGDRGAVALAGAVQALLATVFLVSSTQSVLAVWSRFSVTGDSISFI